MRSKLDGRAQLRSEVLAANSAQTVEAVLAQLKPLTEPELRVVFFGHPKLRPIRALEAWPALLEAESGVAFVGILRRSKLTAEELFETRLLSAVRWLVDQSALADAAAGASQLLLHWDSLVEQSSR